MDPILVYLLLINAAGFLLMLSDKQKAKKNLWRIPEKVLLGCALLGGSFGCMLAMNIAWHKTKHPAFSIGLPVILAVQVLLLLLVKF